MLGAALLSLACAVTWAGERPKVVVIGFDGADARLVETWMDAGELPHLAELRDAGTFAPLQPTNPPQTPVSWASFATGTDPGQTEIFDFLKRNPNDYLPDFAMISETRRPFLFGERNPLLLGAIAGAAALLLALLATMLLRASGLVRVALALLVGGAVGFGVGSAAAAWLPLEVPDAVNNRKGSTMWELARDAGLRARVIRVPATFPAEDLGDGQMVSGLGVPDMRGRVGTPAYYTSDPDFSAGDNEFSLELVKLRARRGRIETRILGPRNKPFFDYVVDRRVDALPASERAAARREVRRELEEQGVAARLDVEFAIEATDSDIVLELPGTTRTLKLGEWSDWVELDFAVNALVDRVSPLRGIVRFKLLALDPHLELYMSPINFHPDCHPIAFSWPPEYSEDLADRFGLFKTIGWALDTWSLPSGVGDEELFLEDMHFTVAKYEEIMEGLLAEGDVDLYVQIFYFTDRIGHLFWRFIDPGHPLYDPLTSERYAGEMLAAYKRMDGLVGKARALAGDEALFLVVSDHGFSSFRRGVNYNNWLVENGFMALKNQPTEAATLEKLFDTRDLFADVDWTRTQAYAMGLGSIYINLVGRERYGTVLPGPDYEDVRQRIKDGLESLVDPLTGDRPVSRVMTREEMYGEYDPNLVPDLRAANSLNYRVSWQTSLGGFGSELFEDNAKPWSGDHCSNDPDVVRGIFFSNRPIRTELPEMIDIMPTVLSVLGVEIPDEVEGKPLL